MAACRVKSIEGSQIPEHVNKIYFGDFPRKVDNVMTLLSTRKTKIKELGLRWNFYSEEREEELFKAIGEFDLVESFVYESTNKGICFDRMLPVFRTSSLRFLKLDNSQKLQGMYSCEILVLLLKGELANLVEFSLYSPYLEAMLVVEMLNALKENIMLESFLKSDQFFQHCFVYGRISCIATSLQQLSLHDVTATAAFADDVGAPCLVRIKSIINDKNELEDKPTKCYDIVA